MTIPVWLFVLLIVTNFFTFFVVLLIIYIIAGLHDLYFVKYKKQNEKEVPYFIEKDLPEKK